MLYPCPIILGNFINSSIEFIDSTKKLISCWEFILLESLVSFDGLVGLYFGKTNVAAASFVSWCPCAFEEGLLRCSPARAFFFFFFMDLLREWTTPVSCDKLLTGITNIIDHLKKLAKLKRRFNLT
jgi:hypothetical protein